MLKNPVSKRLGQPLDLTDQALDQAAAVAPVDVALAKAVWAHHAPKNLVDLMDAALEQS